MAEGDTVKAVYELRDAAIEYGRAVAAHEASGPPGGDLLSINSALEEKTVAALDECSENAAEAADEARGEASA